MVAVSKKARGLKKKKLARDDPARRVMITRESRWESQRLFFPYHADLALFTHSQTPVLHYMKVIWQEITHGKVSGKFFKRVLKNFEKKKTDFLETVTA